jgi:hypothetical protein
MSPSKASECVSEGGVPETVASQTIAPQVQDENEEHQQNEIADSPAVPTSIDGLEHERQERACDEPRRRHGSEQGHATAQDDGADVEREER